ncbi:hypothetical protein CXP51_01305 [Ethanoligenens harbinense]|nr:hypothetical protein CXQ68_01300 [Ethanoligenens harbinense YUAN-3]AYF37694.1 hypothetical protein CXP51_01305 [Ethanoligenens harbinense]AYF40414.1 hypothetical protein CN246_01300 [Ethanoligenens harbinense]
MRQTFGIGNVPVLDTYRTVRYDKNRFVSPAARHGTVDGCAYSGAAGNWSSSGPVWVKSDRRTDWPGK